MCLKQDPNKIHTVHFVDIAMSVKILNNSPFLFSLPFVEKTTSFCSKIFHISVVSLWCGVIVCPTIGPTFSYKLADLGTRSD